MAPTWRPIKNTVLQFGELLRVFSTALHAQFVYVGSVLYRISTLPIGGLLSKAATTQVMGRAERRWTIGTLRVITGFAPDGLLWG